MPASPTPPQDPIRADLPSWVNGVARSFALSLRVLPHEIRWPVGLAYLLARASDAVADSVTGHKGWSERLLALDELGLAIQNSAQGPGAKDTACAAIAPLIGSVPDPRERALLLALPELLQGLSTLAATDRTLIATVCQHIVSGQRLDLIRFAPVRQGIRALTHSAELADYTWRVAGCVGHFWTRMCESRLPGWRLADLEVMLQAGSDYGMALQRLNILRDTAADLSLGRCYWPLEELQTIGWSPEQFTHAVQQGDATAMAPLHTLMSSWIDQTRRGLCLGLAYSRAIGPWRLRWASALPALIGLKTLQVIEASGTMALHRPVKVNRTWVRRLLWRLVLGGGTSNGLGRLGLDLGAPDAGSLTLVSGGTIGA